PTVSSAAAAAVPTRTRLFLVVMVSPLSSSSAHRAGRVRCIPVAISVGGGAAGGPELSAVTERRPYGPECRAGRRARDNGPMSLFRDDGIVLRTQKLGEADRIITLLTRGHGRVRAVARGVRRTKSKFGARLEPFS